MTNIFVQFPNVKGSVSSENYAGWVGIDSLSFGGDWPILTSVGRVTDRNSSLPNFSEVTMYKRLDASTVPLFQLFCLHSVMKQVEIHVCNTNNTLNPYVKYRLYNVAIAKHQHMVSAGSLPSEELLLNYTKFELTYIGNSSAHVAGSPKTMGFDLETARVL